MGHRRGIAPLLVERVKTRTPQINRSACCVDVLTKDTRAAGEATRREPGHDQPGGHE